LNLLKKQITEVIRAWITEIVRRNYACVLVDYNYFNMESRQIWVYKLMGDSDYR
tara:strand:+ start:298 stop:459 length:162 start_codon:yes stop_codon:yes gene_type:complete